MLPPGHYSKLYFLYVLPENEIISDGVIAESYTLKAFISIHQAKKTMNISDIMNTWTLQMGFPVVTVYKNGTVTQNRFLLDPNPDYSKEKYKSPFK